MIARLLGALCIALAIFWICPYIFLYTQKKLDMPQVDGTSHQDNTRFITALCCFVVCVRLDLIRASIAVIILVILNILARTDSRYRVLPNCLVLFLLFFSALLHFFQGFDAFVRGFLMALQVAIIQILTHCIIKAFIHGSPVWGGGDFKLACTLSFLFADDVIWWFGLWSVSFLVIAVIRFVRCLWKKGELIALGPSLCISAQVFICLVVNKF